SLPPSINVSETTETTINDPYAPPMSVRAPVPEAFLRRLSEILSKVAPELPPESEPISIATSLRKILGEDGLATLYAELAGPTARAVLSGDLGAIPLAEVLQLLQLQRQTGVLTITQGAIEVHAVVRDGLVDLATSRGAADEFRLGRYLVEGGKLDRAQL